MPLFNKPTPNPDVVSRIDAAQQPEFAGAVRRRETIEEKLKRRQAEIAARLQDIATKKKVESRVRGSRLDRIIGAACRADESLHEGIRSALKTVKSPADREFLKIEGWL